MAGTTQNPAVTDVDDIVDLDAAIKALQARKRAIVDAKRDMLGQLALPVATAVLEQAGGVDNLAFAPKSGWHGCSEFGIPVEIDGVKFNARVQLTHVESTERDKKAIAAAKKAGKPHPFQAQIDAQKSSGTPDADSDGDDSAEEASDKGVNLTKSGK